MKSYNFTSPINAIGEHAALFPREMTWKYMPVDVDCLIYVRWYDDNGVPRLETTRTGLTAKNLIKAVQKANLSGVGGSMYHRLIVEFAPELAAYAAGSEAGSDD